jgi:hypothetical protein
MQSIKLVIFILCFISIPSKAESLNEKVARNAANCLTGHMATNSDDFQSGKTSKYTFLIEDILGSSNGMNAVKLAQKKLDSAISMLGSTKAEEGTFLINMFCPSIDKIIAEKK